MYQNYFFHILSGSILLLAMLACGSPAQTIQPTAGLDPNAIETSIARTLEASAKQTEQASLIPSAVPTETLTPVPKISSSGSSVVNLADGSTQFTDHIAGIQIVFPSLWLVFRVGEPEYYAAWEKPETQNPAFLDIFAGMQNDDPKIFRVNALDVRPGHMPNGIATAINILFQAGDTRSLEQWERVAREPNLPCEGLKFISSSYPTTNNGIRVLVVEKSCRAAGDAGTIYFRYVFLSLPSGTVHLNFETSIDYKDVTLPDFDQVLNSVTMLNP